jgi:TolA-binding protein
LAEAFRTEGKTDEAASTLETFVAAQPEHPLAPVGWLSLGEIRQMQKNETAALEAYRTASGRYAASYAAPMALLAEARLLIAGGSRGEAKAVLESIGTAYPQTPAAMVAAGELSLLGVPAGVPPPAPGSN